MWVNLRCDVFSVNLWFEYLCRTWKRRNLDFKKKIVNHVNFNFRHPRRSDWNPRLATCRLMQGCNQLEILSTKSLISNDGKQNNEGNVQIENRLKQVFLRLKWFLNSKIFEHPYRNLCHPELTTADFDNCGKITDENIIKIYIFQWYWTR